MTYSYTDKRRHVPQFLQRQEPCACRSCKPRIPYATLRDLRDAEPHDAETWAYDFNDFAMAA